MKNTETEQPSKVVWEIIDCDSLQPVDISANYRQTVKNTSVRWREDNTLVITLELM